MTAYVLVTEKDMRGLVAKWAVRQSPYACPDHFEGVLVEVRRRFMTHPRVRTNAALALAELPRAMKEIETFVEEILLPIPGVQQWGQRKNGRQGDAFVGDGIVRAPEPDDDFIDLYALVSNIANEIFHEPEIPV